MYPFQVLKRFRFNLLLLFSVAPQGSLLLVVIQEAIELFREKEDSMIRVIRASRRAASSTTTKRRQVRQCRTECDSFEVEAKTLAPRGGGGHLNCGFFSAFSNKVQVVNNINFGLGATRNMASSAPAGSTEDYLKLEDM